MTTTFKYLNYIQDIYTHNVFTKIKCQQKLIKKKTKYI